MKSKKPKTAWQHNIALIKDYFLFSNDKWRAWLYLLGIIVCVIALVIALMLLNGAFASFWTVFAAKSLMPFLISLGQLTVTLGIYISIYCVKNYLIGKLSIRWRNWIAKKMVNELFEGKNNYLDLKRCYSDEIDNVSQRIQEDAKRYTELSLSLGAGLLEATLGLSLAAISLWLIGGTLAFTLLGLNIIIPGYLLWAALITACVATILTHVIGRTLSKTNQKAESLEANLRYGLTEVYDDAENIAVEHAEGYYRNNILHQIKAINHISNQQLDTKTKLGAFQAFYGQLTMILPSILSAPLYFGGMMAFETTMQVGMLFSQVSMYLGWGITSYDQLADYKTSITRLAELETALKSQTAANPKDIQFKERDKSTLKLKHVTIMPPQSTHKKCIMNDVNLTLVKGEHVMLKGPSGLGKSTLFKVMSGSWRHGQGKVAIPSAEKLYFLPQKPTLPYDTLKAVLAYPEPANTYTTQEYIRALKQVGGMDNYIAQLNKKRHWSKELSGGQQQRISFARAILKKPNWLFLDEATSSLDEESETQIYETMCAMENTTIVSIAHRSTVERHHHKVLFFSVNEARDVSVDIKPALTAG